MLFKAKNPHSWLLTSTKGLKNPRQACKFIDRKTIRHECKMHMQPCPKRNNLKLNWCLLLSNRKLRCEKYASKSYVQQNLPKTEKKSLLLPLEQRQNKPKPRWSLLIQARAVRKSSERQCASIVQCRCFLIIFEFRVLDFSQGTSLADGTNKTFSRTKVTTSSETTSAFFQTACTEGCDCDVQSSIRRTGRGCATHAACGVSGYQGSLCE